MAVKYKSYVKKMYTEQSELFDAIEEAHAEYQLDKKKHQDNFNEQGKEVLRVVEEWENRLCNQMEKGKNSTYSHRLADKFRQEIRVRFPLIDFIGVKVSSKPLEQIPKIVFS